LHQSEQQLCQRRRIYASTGSAANIMMDRESLSEWAKDKPLSILQLDPADRAVLRIAGESKNCITCASKNVHWETSVVAGEGKVAEAN